MRGIAPGIAALLFLAACTTTPERPAATPSTVEHPPVAAPEDRDDKAVLAAVRRLDLCALLATAAAADPTFAGVRPAASSPFRCALSVPEHQKRFVAVEYAAMDTSRRTTAPLVTLGGAKAYVKPHPGGCIIALPISFTVTMQFVAGSDDEREDVCADVQPLVAAVATTLADPGAAQREPVWDRCAVLARLPDWHADEPCRIPTGDVGFGYGTLPGPALGWQPDTVGGVEVAVDNASSGCNVWWRVGPASDPYADGPDLLGQVAQRNCAAAKELVAAVVPVLATAPPTDVPPQHPLLYPPDEPDVPLVGACAHLHTTTAAKYADCLPAVDVPAPKGRDAFVAAALADPNTLCAVAKDAVVTHFGDRMLAVTAHGPALRVDEPRRAGEYRVCYFVAPDREVQLMVDMWLDDVAGLTADVTPLEIAGHPGYSLRDAETIWVGMTGNPDRDGMVKVHVEPGALTQGTQLAPATVGKAPLVLADIVTTYFP